MYHQHLIAFVLAVIMVIITYKYFVRTNSFVTYHAVIGVAIVAVVAFIVYFLIIELIGYFIISGKIYPNTALIVLWPFVVITFLSWLIFGFMNVKPFGYASDFFAILKAFLTTFIPFIAICTVLIGVTYSYLILNSKTADAVLFQNNILYLTLCVVACLVSIAMFYFTNLIKQLNLSPEYSYYKTLDEGVNAENLFIKASEYNSITEPYILPNHKELILIENYSSSNKYLPVKIVYKIDINGKILDTFSEDEAVVTSPNKEEDFFPLVCKNGILSNYDSKRVISWVFDGNKKKYAATELLHKAEWKLDTVQQNLDDVKIVHFYKTEALHCNNLDSVKYNGNRYFNIMNGTETIKIRLDNVYSKDKYSNSENCAERKLEYYSPVGFNFTLLRLDENKYYIILNQIS